MKLGTTFALIGAFVAILVLFQLAPEIITSNQTIQDNVDANALTKLGANLGEWLFMLGGVGAAIYAVFRGVKG